MPDWKPGDPLPEAQNSQIDSKKFDEDSMNLITEENENKSQTPNL
jgi:hypothetical protein